MAIMRDRPGTGGGSDEQARRTDPATRKYAITAGVLFIIATAASLLSQPFLAPLADPDFLVSIAAHRGQVGGGVLLGLVAGLASAGIAISLYPVLRRFGTGLALGAVGFRLIEGTLTLVSVIAVLSLVSLSQDYVAAGRPADPSYRTVGQTLLAERDWLGNVGLVLAFSIGGLLYYLALYRARLIPRWLSAWGVGAVVLLMVVVPLLVLGVIDPMSPVQIVLALPIAVQEMVLAVWLIVRGFAPAALAADGGKAPDQS